MLTCDFTLCIYQECGHCKLESIDINELGMCDCAIIVDLPEERIALEKKKQLLALDKRDNGYRR